MKLWIIVHHHKHGVDVFPFFGEKEPSDEQAIEKINELSFFEGDDEEEEYYDVDGPYDLPTIEQPALTKS